MVVVFVASYVSIRNILLLYFNISAFISTVFQIFHSITPIKNIVHHTVQPRKKVTQEASYRHLKQTACNIVRIVSLYCIKNQFGIFVASTSFMSFPMKEQNIQIYRFPIPMHTPSRYFVEAFLRSISLFASRIKMASKVHTLLVQ